MLDRKVTHRLIGAGIIIVAAAIILPQVLDGQRPPELDVKVEVSKAPAFPEVKIAPAQPIDTLPDSGTAVQATTASPSTDKSPQDISLVPVPKKASETPTPATKAEVTKVVTPAPTPVKTTTAPASSASTERWTVQIASFSQQSNATRLVDKLKKANYPAYSITTSSLFKVFVGPELDRDASDKVRDDIQKKFSLKGIVVKFAEN